MWFSVTKKIAKGMIDLSGRQQYAVVCDSGYVGLCFCQILLNCALKMNAINTVNSGEKKNRYKEHRYTNPNPEVYL